MKLPTINGLETHLAIRKIEPEAITIIMTAYGEEMAEMVTSVLQNDAYACLYKPLDMPSVLELIEEVLKREKERDG